MKDSESLDKLLNLLNQIEILEAHFMRLENNLPQDSMELMSSTVQQARELFEYIEDNLSTNSTPVSTYPNLHSYTVPKRLYVDED